MLLQTLHDLFLGSSYADQIETYKPFYILRCFNVLLGLFKLHIVFAVVDQMEDLSYQTLNVLKSIQDL